MWECQMRRQADCGKGNRVLYTKKLPEETEVDFSGTTRKDRPVRTAGEEIGLTNVPSGVGAQRSFPTILHLAAVGLEADRYTWPNSAPLW
jgi:hypothetical protein